MSTQTYSRFTRSVK